MKNKALTGAVALMLLSFGLHAQSPQNVEKSVNLDEVVVSSSRMGTSLKKIPQKVEVITENDIKAMPANNLADLLKSLSCVDILQYPGANAGIGMRGFAPNTNLRNYTLLLIDGKPAATTNISTIPTSFIERIEVVKGPYSVLYGSDAMGGIVNIITKKVVSGTSATIGVGYGSNATNNLNASVNMKPLSNLGFNFSFSRTAQDKDYKIGTNNLIKDVKYERELLVEKSYGDVMENTKYSTINLAGKISYDVTDQWSIDLTQVYTVTPEMLTPGGYLKVYDPNKVSYSVSNTNLDVKREADGNTLTISPYFAYNDRITYQGLTPNALVSYSKAAKEYGVKMSDMQRFGYFSVVGGIDVDRIVSVSKSYDNTGALKAPYTPDYDIMSSSAFLQGSVDWKGLYASLGVRYNLTRFGVDKNDFLKSEASSKLYSNFCPSLGIRYNIIPELSVHASAGMGYYIPDAYKVAGQYQTTGKYGKTFKGNPNLKPETSTSFDAGVSFTKDNWLTADVTYFYTFYKDKIVDDKSNKDYVTFKNANSAKMSGIEATLSWDILKMMGMQQSLSLYANYTHMFNNNFKDQSQKDAEFDLLYVRKNMANFGVNMDWSGRFGARFNGRFIGSRLENNWFSAPNRPWLAENNYTEGGYNATNGIVKHPNHLVFDMSAYYNVCDFMKLGISVSNLFNENYTEKDGYNMPGRIIMGTMSFNISK